MPLSTAAKAALCLCPPAVMAGTVASVPAAKRAVHHLTAPHHAARPARHAARGAAKPGERVAQRADCAPIVPGPLPIAPIVTYAEPIPAEPSTARGGTPGAIGGSPTTILAAEAPVPVGPGTGGTVPGSPPGTGGPAPAVPEPASWLLLITGVGMLGATLRARRQFSGRVAAGATVWSVGGVTEAGDAAVSVAMQSGAAKSALASAAGKAALCVCPAALVAGGVVAIPPVRHAVHVATAPATIPALPPVRAAVPCDAPMTVPVSAVSIGGFPNVVTTVARSS